MGIEGIEVLKPGPVEKGYTEAQVLEIHRCALAYGWEIGNGAPITEKLLTTDGNPFVDPNWSIPYIHDNQ